MARRTLIIGLAIVLVIVIVGGIAGYTLMNQPASSPSPSPTLAATASPAPTDDTAQQQVRDQAMAFIESNHPETALYMQNLSWSGGRIEAGLVGAENYEYTTLTSALGSAGWTVTINYPVVPNPTYTITANYTQTGVQTPVDIKWAGTSENGTITETAYASNVNAAPAPQEQARNDVMSYIQAVHVETDQFMQGLTWEGGKVETGLIGAEKYVYTTAHGMAGGAWWTVQLDYPVVPNAVYTVTANYTQTGVQSPYNVAWNGTWQNGAVNETGYTSNVPVSQEQIRDSVMNYMGISHSETAQFMQDLNWTGGKVQTGLVGAEKYNYTTLISAPGAAGWTVTLDYPVVPNPVYTVTATYTQTGVQTPYHVEWEGTWQSGAIAETKYTFSP